MCSWKVGVLLVAAVSSLLSVAGCTAANTAAEIALAGCFCHAERCTSVTSASGQAAIEAEQRTLEIQRRQRK